MALKEHCGRDLYFKFHTQGQTHTCYVAVKGDLPHDRSFMRLCTRSSLDVQQNTLACPRLVTPTDAAIKIQAHQYLCRVKWRHVAAKKEEFHLHYSWWCGGEHVSCSEGPPPCAVAEWLWYNGAFWRWLCGWGEGRRRAASLKAYARLWNWTRCVEVVTGNMGAQRRFTKHATLTSAPFSVTFSTNMSQG